MLLQALCINHFKAIGEFKLELQSGNAQFESKSAIFVLCDLEIWWLTLKNNRVPLLCCFKLCASFHHHMSIQTGAETAKLGFDLCDLDLWPWNFAWTSLLSLVITPEIFHEDMMMGTEWKRCDRQTDRQTDWTIHRAALSQLRCTCGIR